MVPIIKNVFEAVVDNNYGVCFEELVCAHLIHGGVFNTKCLSLERNTVDELQPLWANLRYVSNVFSTLDRICAAVDENYSTEDNYKFTLMGHNVSD